MKTALVSALLAILCMPAFSGDPANTIRVDVEVYDIGVDQPVSHTTVELVMQADCGSGREIFRSTAVTNDKGQFEIALPVGGHLLSVTAPGHETVRDCAQIVSLSDFDMCKSRIRQGLIVRTISGQRRLPTDIVDQSPCAQAANSVCEELKLPMNVVSRHVVFVDEADNPIANLKLEFRFHQSQKRSELFGTVVTNENGAADLTEIFAQPHAPGSLVTTGYFRLKLSSTPTDQPQRITMVKWKCGGHERWQAATAE